MKNERSGRAQRRFSSLLSAPCRFHCATCFLLLLAFYCLGSTVASAQDPQARIWTSDGPGGAYVRTLAIDPVTPTTLYAGTVEDRNHPLWGVFKSIDSGNTWSAVNTGLPSDFGVYALAIDPVDPSTVYAGTYGYGIGVYSGGVFKSIDGGATWSEVDSGPLANLSIITLAIDPITSSTIYAGTWGGGAFVSVDGGNSWSAINAGLRDLIVSALAIDPQTPSTLYAGTVSGGVFKSIDGGNTWSAVNVGLPTNYQVLALAIDPVTPSTLYAGLDGSARGGGVFKSLDGGNTWSEADTGLPTTTAGVGFHALAIDPVTPSTLYAGSFGAGAFISTDGGDSWSDFNAGLTDPLVHTLAIDPQTPTTLFAGTCNLGVYGIQ
jgi:photosystem II stability/assembly factor-like uncharacterized protein